MDDKLAVVTNALQSIRKMGMCCISISRKEEIEIVKRIIKDCGRDYEASEMPDGYGVQIFLK